MEPHLAPEARRLTDTRRRNLVLRQRAAAAVRAYFGAADFLEVETPALVPSPGLDVHLDAFEVVTGRGTRYLHTSPEYQMKRLLAAGLPRIFQLCRAFRHGERGHLHNPEFTMLEWYRAGAGMQAVMDDTEALVVAVASALHGRPHLPGHPPQTRPQQQTGDDPGAGGIDLTRPWPRIRVDEAFRRFAGVEVADILPDEDRFFQLLVERVEPALGRGRPTFLTHYPAAMASLARLAPEDPSVAERFEVYVDGVELANGFGELTDPDEQRARLLADQRARQRLGKPVYPIDERFLDALRQGIPASGGNALGFDRLVMLATGAACIDDVLAFTIDEL